MEIDFLLAGLVFRFLAEMNLEIPAALKSFAIEAAANVDVTVHITRNWDSIVLPPSPPLGEDMLCRYYRQGNTAYCVTLGGAKGAIGCAVYDANCRNIACALNVAPFLQPTKDLGSILRMIPMRAIFQRFGVLFLHASRVCYKGKAILFSAPSGTGKTTQAKLWNQYRGAGILCNDRTLLRKVNNGWNTYGYPLDGSEPVYSNEICTLGAVVLLAQGQDNRIERLNPAAGSALLMRQAVIDVWNPDARMMAMKDILSLFEDIPVYKLTCTPDERAVETLEAKLLEDEVIMNG